MVDVFLSLGSNMGDRKTALKSACDHICAVEGCSFVGQSPIYETTPVGGPAQDMFLNLVVHVKTDRRPSDMLAEIQAIEKKMGRTRTTHWGPRIIDIDILFFDALILKDETLTIPHPLLHKRLFVLFPLSDLVPDMHHPVLKQSIQQLLDLCIKSTGEDQKITVYGKKA